MKQSPLADNTVSAFRRRVARTAGADSRATTLFVSLTDDSLDPTGFIPDRRGRRGHGRPAEIIESATIVGADARTDDEQPSSTRVAHSDPGRRLQ